MSIIGAMENQWKRVTKIFQFGNQSNLPRYIVPLTHFVPDFIRLCQAYYMPEQRCIVNKEKEILFYITEESINSMLQMSHDPNSASLSIEYLTQLYLDLDFNTSSKYTIIFFQIKLILLS